MSANGITWVGMDAHQNSIKLAALFPDRPEPVEWTEATTPEAIRRLARKLQREAPGEVRSRSQRADPPDGSQSCGSARDAGATREY